MLLVLVAVMLLALSACDEDRTVILSPGACEDCDADGITGVVLDLDRNPVAGAAIGLVYMLEGVELPGDWDAEKPRTQITFELGEIELVSLVIYDNAGSPVRTLVDETTEETPETIYWDAIDDDGRMVPVGLYFMRAEFADQTSVERMVFYYDHDIDAFLDKPNAVTDADGNFRVPRNLIPVGAEIPSYDEEGVFFGLHEVLDEIKVIAVIEYLGEVRHVAQLVTLADDDSGATVNLVLPISQN